MMPFIHLRNLSAILRDAGFFKSFQTKIINFTKKKKKIFLIFYCTKAISRLQGVQEVFLREAVGNYNETLLVGPTLSNGLAYNFLILSFSSFSQLGWMVGGGVGSGSVASSASPCSALGILFDNHNKHSFF